jgi:hypothetical protein
MDTGSFFFSFRYYSFFCYSFSSRSTKINKSISNLCLDNFRNYLLKSSRDKLVVAMVVCVNKCYNLISPFNHNLYRICDGLTKDSTNISIA